MSPPDPLQKQFLSPYHKVSHITSQIPCFFLLFKQDTASPIENASKAKSFQCMWNTKEVVSGSFIMHNILTRPAPQKGHLWEPFLLVCCPSPQSAHWYLNTSLKQSKMGSLYIFSWLHAAPWWSWGIKASKMAETMTKDMLMSNIMLAPKRSVPKIELLINSTWSKRPNSTAFAYS